MDPLYKISDIEKFAKFSFLLFIFILTNYIYSVKEVMDQGL